MATTYPWRDDPRWQRLVAAREVGDGPVFTYQSAHDPWLTSSYYFETERGVVLFDTQLFLDSAEELWAEICKNTSGELFCIIVTHAHPDHFYGNTFLRRVAPSASIVTSAAVERDMRETAEGRFLLVQREWPNDIPASVDELVYPDLTFAGSCKLVFCSLTVELREYGPAEATAQIAGWLPEYATLIAGDLLSNRQHLYLAESTAASWCSILDQLEQFDPERLLTGHQGAAGPELIAETKAVLTQFAGLVSEALGPSVDPSDVARLNDTDRARIRAEMLQRFPDWYDATMLHGSETILEYALQGLRSDEEGDALVEGASRFA